MATKTKAAPKLVLPKKEAVNELARKKLTGFGKAMLNRTMRPLQDVINETNNESWLNQGQ